MTAEITVIIACYNGGRYLPQCIGGLRAQDMPLEIIVVDDGSTDDSARIARDLGCVVRAVPHAGQAAARNAGLALAAGAFVLFHDQDDMLRPGMLRPMLDLLTLDRAAAAVMAQAMDFLSPDLDARLGMRLKPRAEPYFGFLGATLFRKAVLEGIGGFSEELRAGEAADLLLRVRAAGYPVRRAPVIVMDRRLHARNTSRLLRQTQFRDYAASLRRKLAR